MALHRLRALIRLSHGSRRLADLLRGLGRQQLATTGRHRLAPHSDNADARVTSPTTTINAKMHLATSSGRSGPAGTLVIPNAVRYKTGVFATPLSLNVSWLFLGSHALIISGVGVEIDRFRH